MPGANGGATEIATDLVQRARAAGAEHAQATYVTSEKFEVNLDTRDVTLLRTTMNESITVTVFRDGKKGSASFNGLTDDAVAAAIQTALDGADAGMPDEANVIAEAESNAPTSHGPEEADREAMLDAVLVYLSAMKDRYPKILSDTTIHDFTDVVATFANSHGVVQQERRSHYGFGAMFGAKDGAKATSFNYTGVATCDPISDLLNVGTVRQLLDECMQSLDPRPVPEKFVGDVIFTPDSMSDLVGVLSGALSGYSLMAGTTPFKDKQGEAIASPAFSLLNRPQHPAFARGADFDGFGVPTRDLDVIVDGVLNEFLIDFYISKKLGMPQTAGETNFIVPPGEQAIADIIKETERGIILSRFSGARPNSNLDFSGVAKNSFYVENGEIQFALIETMAAGNFQDLLKNIRAISQEHVNFGGSDFPYLAASGVTISSE